MPELLSMLLIFSLHLRDTLPNFHRNFMFS
jgi:hypothetical protein